MSTSEQIPLFSGVVSAQAEAACLSVLRAGQIANGPLIERLEHEFGALCGRTSMVSTNDMTSALAMALRLGGIGAGDEVLTLAYSCMSSNSAIAHVGATPVWVDIDPSSGSLDMDDLARALTPRTRALTMYHVAGYPGPARAAAEFCKKHGLLFVEDCNAAAGSTLANIPLGCFGDYAVWSLYPNRQLNALEGGMLACPDESTAARARKLRRFGIDARSFRDRLGEIDPKADIREIGTSSALSQVNASVGLAHLPTFQERLRATAANVEQLDRTMQRCSRLQPVRPITGGVPNHWAYLVLAHGRDELIAELKSLGVQCSKLHQRNDVYGGFHAASRHLPGTDRWMDQVLALPCGPWLSTEQIYRLSEILVRTCV